MMDVGERITPHNLFSDAVRDEFKLHIHRYRLAVPSCVDKTVLDSGCGVGNGSFLLSAVATHVLATDNDPEAIAFARKYYSSSNLRFEQHDALEPLNQPFETIVSFDVIEHVQNVERYLRSLASNLVPGGTLVISTPNKNMLQLLYPEPNQYHVHEMTEQEFTTAINTTFRITKLNGQTLESGEASITDDLSRARTFIAWCTTK